jgi:hypothetical protein
MNRTAPFQRGWGAIDAHESSIKTKRWFNQMLALHRPRRMAYRGSLVYLRDVTTRRVFDDRMLRHKTSGWSTQSSAMAARFGLSMSNRRPAASTADAATQISSLLL